MQLTSGAGDERVDPNCPGSQDCYGSALQVEEPAEVQIISEASEGEKETLKDALPENPNAVDVRELLRESGFTEEELSNLTDEEILKIYKDTLSNF